MKNITPIEATKILKEDTGAILVDVRTYGEVAEEAVPGAKHIPLDELSGRLDEIENFSSLLFMCRSGGRSASAAAMVEAAGFPNVMNVSGGIIAWAGAGLPVVQDGKLQGGFAKQRTLIIGSILALGILVVSAIAVGPSVKMDANMQQANVLAAEGSTSLQPSSFATAIAKNGVSLLDVRTQSEYASGHIGNAVNIDFYDPSFRDKLNTLNKNSEYYVYCRSGHRSGGALTIMKELGFTNVHDLAGGLESWQMEGRPIGL